MSIRNLKKKTLAGAVSIALAIMVLLPVQQAAANSNLRNEMNRMFGSMSNATAPGVFETNRRGVISGGSLVVRNKIMNTSIVAWQPPSFNAGCGGIDLFGGSFSFINKEQFVALARSIASNAAGYAFYLALDSMCPSCRSVIDNIQKKIQELNQFFGNSCQLAQGLVTDPVGSFEKAREVTGGLAKAVVGGAGDIFESMTGVTGEAPTQNTPKTPEVEKKMRGNIVWEALKTKGVSGWFSYGGDNLNMAIMTVTGTVIIGKDEPAPDGKGTSPKISRLPSGLISGLISFESLVNGGKVKIYRCDENDKCLVPSSNVSETDITGFAQMVRTMLIGQGATPGIIQKIRMGVALQPAERNFIAALPKSMGSMIFRLSRISEEVATGFVIDSSEPLGREMAFDLLKAFSSAAYTAALAEQSNPHATDAMNLLQESRMEIYEQYALMVAKGEKLGDLMQRYNEILKAASIMEINPDVYSPSVTPSSSGA